MLVWAFYPFVWPIPGPAGTASNHIKMTSALREITISRNGPTIMANQFDNHGYRKKTENMSFHTSLTSQFSRRFDIFDYRKSESNDFPTQSENQNVLNKSENNVFVVVENHDSPNKSENRDFPILTISRKSVLSEDNGFQTSRVSISPFPSSSNPRALGTPPRKPKQMNENACSSFCIYHRSRGFVSSLYS